MEPRGAVGADFSGNVRLTCPDERGCLIDGALVRLSAGRQDTGTPMSIVAMSRPSLPTGALVLFVALSAPDVSLAQQPTKNTAQSESIPADVMNKLDNDLAKFQADIQSSFRQTTAWSPIGKKIEVTSDFASVLGGAKLSAPKEFAAKKGDKFLVLDKANDFYAVAADDGKTGWITVGDVKPDFVKLGVVEENTTQQDHDVTTRLFQTLTEDAVRFRDAYKDNKYLHVSGFTVHTGAPPAVDLSFSFR
jgi:hypothetical protein